MGSRTEKETSGQLTPAPQFPMQYIIHERELRALCHDHGSQTYVPYRPVVLRVRRSDTAPRVVLLLSRQSYHSCRRINTKVGPKSKQRYVIPGSKSS